MYDPVTAVVAVAAIASAGSAVYSGIQQDKAAKKAAKEEKRVAGEQADQIREKGRRIIAAQRAALGSAGIKVDEGTGDALQKETRRLSEQDALSALRGGKARASLLKSQGKAAKVTGILNGVSSLASAGGSFVSASSASRSAASLNAQTGAGAAATRTVPRYSLLGGTGANKFGL